jgi:hypothetical protein
MWFAALACSRRKFSHLSMGSRLRGNDEQVATQQLLFACPFAP